MKYVFQLMIILGVSFLGEILRMILPLPIPASVYGLLILLLLLMTKIVKLSQVEDTATYMISIMPLFFIEPSVEIMTSFGVVKGHILPLCIASFISFAAVIGVTGATSQAVIRFKKKKSKAKENKNELK